MVNLAEMATNPNAEAPPLGTIIVRQCPIMGEKWPWSHF